jgi:hypothetical protein
MYIPTVDISAEEMYFPLEMIASSRGITSIISCSAYKYSWYHVFRWRYACSVSADWL